MLLNLQVGLAVDDIKSVQEKAALKKEALQVCSAVSFLFHCHAYIAEYTMTLNFSPLD